MISLKRDRSLETGRHTLIMGVLNATPDSFYPGSRTSTTEAALARAREYIAAGADILDIGGESSRPGSEPVAASVERARVVPVIEAIRAESDIPISIDSCKASVAAQALDVGADIINDISALRADPDMAALAGERQAAVVLMHIQGTPRTMQHNPIYTDTVADVYRELQQAIERACANGVANDRIIIDPGIGFGKRLEDNLRILADLGCFRQLGMPLLIGISRKSMIGALLSAHGTARPVEERLFGTLAAQAWAILQGADILRVPRRRASG